MNSNKKTARITGVIFLIAFVTSVLGILLSGLSDPSFTESTDLLINVSANSMKMRISILFDLLSSASVVALGIGLFASLKEQNKNIALMGLSFFVAEAIMLAVSRISVFSLLQLSEEYVKAGAPDSSYFHTLGQLFVHDSDSAYLIVQFFYGLGALTFYYLFFKSKLIPRFISVWGYIATAIMLAGALLLILDQFTAGDIIDWITGIPTGLLEIFIGVWLIVKGFNSSAIVSQSAKTDIN